MVSFEYANVVKERHSERLLKTPGVWGVGVERGDDRAPTLVVHIDPAHSHLRDQLPKQLEGCPVHVVEDGPFQAFEAGATAPP